MPATDAAPDFRLRGLDVTRLDTFVDAAFAFGATVLLVSAGSLPADYLALRPRGLRDHYVDVGAGAAAGARTVRALAPQGSDWGPHPQVTL